MLCSWNLGSPQIMVMLDVLFGGFGGFWKFERNPPTWGHTVEVWPNKCRCTMIVFAKVRRNPGTVFFRGRYPISEKRILKKTCSAFVCFVSMAWTSGYEPSIRGYGFLETMSLQKERGSGGILSMMAPSKLSDVSHPDTWCLFRVFGALLSDLVDLSGLRLT